MKRDVEEILRDIIQSLERRGDRVTVRVPPPPPVPQDMGSLAQYLNDINYRLISVELAESMRPQPRPRESQPELETGRHRVEELQRALAEARTREALHEERRHSSITWTKRKVTSLLLTIIGVLIVAIAVLVLKLVDSHGAPAPQPRQEEARPR